MASERLFTRNFRLKPLRFKRQRDIPEPALQRSGSTRTGRGLSARRSWLLQRYAHHITLCAAHGDNARKPSAVALSPSSGVSWKRPDGPRHEPDTSRPAAGLWVASPSFPDAQRQFPRGTWPARNRERRRSAASQISSQCISESGLRPSSNCMSSVSLLCRTNSSYQSVEIQAPCGTRNPACASFASRTALAPTRASPASAASMSGTTPCGEESIRSLPGSGQHGGNGECPP